MGLSLLYTDLSAFRGQRQYSNKSCNPGRSMLKAAGRLTASWRFVLISLESDRLLEVKSHATNSVCRKRSGITGSQKALRRVRDSVRCPRCAERGQGVG